MQHVRRDYQIVLVASKTLRLGIPLDVQHLVPHLPAAVSETLLRGPQETRGNVGEPVLGLAGRQHRKHQRRRRSGARPNLENLELPSPRQSAYRLGHGVRHQAVHRTPHLRLPVQIGSAQLAAEQQLQRIGPAPQNRREGRAASVQQGQLDRTRLPRRGTRAFRRRPGRTPVVHPTARRHPRHLSRVRQQRQEAPEEPPVILRHAQPATQLLRLEATLRATLPTELAERLEHEPLRRRKLLLNKREIRKLIGKLVERGFTLVPVRMYFKRGLVKVTVGVAKGKKTYDKREAIKRRQVDRETRAMVKERYR